MRRLLTAAMVIGTLNVAGADPVAPAKPAAPKKLAPMKAKPAPAPRLFGRDWNATPAAAVEKPADKEAGKGRLLYSQGLSAYKAGNYNAAVKKFTAAMDSTPSPELIYHAAQAHRLKGDRAKALELYEQYLEVAPDGSAAPVCRWYVERLRDTP